MCLILGGGGTSAFLTIYPLFAESDLRQGFWVRVMLIGLIFAANKDNVIILNSASPRLVLD
jgi:hypothetical protein